MAAALAVSALFPARIMAGELSALTRVNVQNIVEATVPQSMIIGKVKVNSLTADDAQRRVTIDLNETYAYVPFTHDSINRLTAEIAKALPKQYSGYKVALTIDGNEIDAYMPLFGRDVQRKHEKRFITRVEPKFTYKSGLDGNIIALWQSHGWYFEPKLNRWEWQRARIFQTVEDLYTQSFVMPYLMPMLENAGAIVMSPRERDTSSYEAIIDADGGYAQPGYSETKGSEKWEKGEGTGFAYKRKQYEGFQNPFTEGAYRVVKATKNKKKLSTASWNVIMPEAGTYAVYISYKSLPNSATDVAYRINALDGEHNFVVNQQMGGGTWIYLGHFPLIKGLPLPRHLGKLSCRRLGGVSTIWRTEDSGGSVVCIP